MKSLWINRTLVSLTILLALTSGYLLSERKIEETPPALEPKTPVLVRRMEDRVTLPPISGGFANPFQNLLYKSLPVRTYLDQPISLDQLSRILFSAQGVITRWGDRTAPSYKSQYPLTLSLLVRQVEGVEAGVYAYIPDNHALGYLGPLNEADVAGAFSQASALTAPVILAVSIDQENLKGDPLQNRAAELEAGQVAQNVYLSAGDQGLGTVLLPFPPAAQIRIPFYVPSSEEVIWVMPVGIPGR